MSGHTGHVSIRTGPWSNGIRLSSLMNLVYFRSSGDGSRMQYGKKPGQRSSDMLWPMFCSETFCVGIHLEFTFDMYHLPKDCIRPRAFLYAMVVPDGRGLIQQDNVPWHIAKIVQEWLEEHDKISQISI